MNRLLSTGPRNCKASLHGLRQPRHHGFCIIISLSLCIKCAHRARHDPRNYLSVPLYGGSCAGRGFQRPALQAGGRPANCRGGNAPHVGTTRQTRHARHVVDPHFRESSRAWRRTSCRGWGPCLSENWEPSIRWSGSAMRQPSATRRRPSSCGGIFPFTTVGRVVRRRLRDSSKKPPRRWCRKFGGSQPQTVMIGPLDPGGSSNRYYRTLASNLRGRTLQLFPPQVGAIRDAGGSRTAGPDAVLPDRQGGLVLRIAESGGRRMAFIRAAPNSSARTPPASSAGPARRSPRPSTSLRLDRRAAGRGQPLAGTRCQPGRHDRRVAGAGLPGDRGGPGAARQAVGTTRRACARCWRMRPPSGRSAAVVYDAILSDMNGDARESISRVIRLAKHLRHGRVGGFHVETAGSCHLRGRQELEASVVALAATAGLRMFARTHLTLQPSRVHAVFRAHIIRRG